MRSTWTNVGVRNSNMAIMMTPKFLSHLKKVVKDCTFVCGHKSGRWEKQTLPSTLTSVGVRKHVLSSSTYSYITKI
jgi:hypothetical protein